MRIIIIGSVAAGTSVAAKARRNNIKDEIVVYEKDADISYSVCGIPYYIGEEYITRENLTPRDPAWFKKRFGIDIKIRHEVIKIDSDKKEIEIKNLTNGEIFKDRYDKLVLATGAAPVKPNIEGIDAENLFFVRNIESADKIKEFILKQKPATGAVVGGGFIGLEMADNLHKMGIDVTIVEGADHIVPGLDKEMAIHAEKYISNMGIKVFKNSKVIKIEKNLIVTEREKIAADIIIFATGVKPNVDIAKRAGVMTGVTGAVKVDKKMMTNIEDIYAVGDCAESYSIITEKAIYRPMGSTANKMGRIAGDVITGGELSFRGVLGTGIVKIGEIAIAQTGLTEKEAAEHGYDVEVIHNIKPNQTEYFEGSSELIIKGIADRESKRLLGAQIVGKSGVDKRIDVFATAITFGAKAEDLFHLDLAYAPPFATTKDPVMYTGMILDNAISHGRKLITAEQLIKNRDKYIVIDVRSIKDYEKGHIDGAENIPFDKLENFAGQMDKEKSYVVHCNKGTTGNAAQNLLINLGFRDVSNLSGGYKQYKMTLSI